MLKDFREFVMRGNVVDLAVAFILGAAFATIIRSLVDDIIMPPIGLLFGGVDPQNLFSVLKDGTTPGPYATLADAQAVAALTINYGRFVNSIVTFIIVAFVLFLIVRSMVNAQRQKEAAPDVATTKPCPYCVSDIAIGATRCSACTAELGPAPATS